MAARSVLGNPSILRKDFLKRDIRLDEAPLVHGEDRRRGPGRAVQDTVYSEGCDAED